MRRRSALSGIGGCFSVLAFDPPILINCRDRVADLKNLVDWLKRAGHQRIILLDNCSSYMPLLDYYQTCGCEVRWLGNNLGSRAPWIAGIVPNEPWVYTDPDIMPIERCPVDAVSYFGELLERHPTVAKVGFGLYMDDLPLNFRYREWEEGPSIRGPFMEAGARRSLIDTTFALYRAGVPEFRYEAIRTEFPYQARHRCPSWYGGPVSEEERYYLDHVPDKLRGPAGSSWAQVTPLQEAA